MKRTRDTVTFRYRRLAEPEYPQKREIGAAVLFIERDAERKARVLNEMAKTLQSDAVPAFPNHLLHYKAQAAAGACETPIAYIAAGNVLADLDEFKRLCSQLVTTQTSGSGHFSSLEVPEEINAILERFAVVSVIAHRKFVEGGSILWLIQ